MYNNYNMHIINSTFSLYVQPMQTNLIQSQQAGGLQKVYDKDVVNEFWQFNRCTQFTFLGWTYVYYPFATS